MHTLKPHKCFFFCLIIFLVIGADVLQAQQNAGSGSDRYTFIFKGESLEKSLQQLVETTGMNLVYDPAIMTEHSVFETARNESAEQILRIILKGSGLDFYRLSSGTYVLTKAPRSIILRGNLTGRVVDRQTGQPLPGAHIMLADAGGGTSAGGTGFFSIPKLEEGPHPVTVTYVGYRPRRDTVWIPAGKTASHRFTLSPEPVLVEPLVVSGILKRLPAPHAFRDQIGSSAVNAARTYGGPDAIKSLDAVSGINFSLPLADFNIQGGEAGEHELRLDGVPIYNPVSMGRLLGAFSPYAIESITINKAGFGAAQGSQLSGIIDVQQHTGSSSSDFILQANPLNVNSRLTHTFTLDEGPEINVMLAGRGNIWRWYRQPQIEQTLGNWDQLDPVLTNHFFPPDSAGTFFQARDNDYDITYYDLHAAARIKHSEFHQTYISGYQGKNRLRTNLFSENALFAADSDAFAPGLFYSIDRYNWTNTMGKIEHRWVINSRFNASLGGYITRHTLDHRYSITNNFEAGFRGNTDAVGEQLRQDAIESLNTGDQNAITESSLQLELGYAASKNYRLEGGLSTTLLKYRFQLSDVYYNAVSADSRSFLLAGFVQNTISLTEKTQIEAGSRLTFIPSRDLVFAEPRISLRYDEPESSIGYWSLQLSGGIYRQFINQFDVSNPGPSSLVPSIRFRVPADFTTTIPKAYHIAGDVLWEPATDWKISFESYYKWIPSRLALNYETLSRTPLLEAGTLSNQQQFITKAQGYAYGGGITLEKHIPSLKLNLKGGYQLNIARQRIPSRFNGTYQPLPSSQPHKVNAGLNWSVLPRFTFLMEWQGIWGRSWGFTKAYYDYLSIRDSRSFGSFSFDDPGGDKLPAFSRLNTGISYRQPVVDSNIRFRLDVFNLLDHDNVLNRWLAPVNSGGDNITYQHRERTLPGFMPSLSIKFSY